MIKKCPLVLFVFLAFLFFMISCSSSCAAGDEKTVTEGKKDDFVITVVNWNLQTFFDAETDGDEYSDFLSNAKWSKDKYLTRLQRLCETISVLNGDIYVFEEIENEAVLYDIANQLAGNSWNAKKMWNYGCFSKEKDSSIGCGILSRYPLLDVKVHSLDIQSQNSSQPSMRPLLQTTIKSENHTLIIYACHWKSKSGGKEETEIWRDWQEFVVSEQLNKLDAGTSVLICGDLNRDIMDFVSNGENKIILRGSNNIQVNTPWLLTDGSFSTNTGSYYYDGNWERIDNFFMYGEGKICGFRVKAEEPWIKETGTPFAFKIGNGEGYSDHLPIMCSVRF